MQIAVLGAGSWGTALARLLFYNGHTVTLWSHRAEHLEEIRQQGENRRFLPNVLLPPDLILSASYADLASAQMVVFAVPTSALPEVAAAAKEHLSEQAILVNVAKGFLAPHAQRVSELLQSLYPTQPVVVLSGPSHAEEVARDLPTTVCVAGTTEAAMQAVQDAFISRSFRVYTNDDLVGVEVGAAVKNIIAIGAGIADGLCLGDNAKAALITRGIAEITRLGVAMGASPATFAGLAGVGDLIVTCTSLHSRNYRVGRDIGRGQPWQQSVAGMGMVAEGISACKHTMQLAERYDVEMPITTQIYKLLYENESPREAMWELMTRERTGEQLP